MCGTCSMDVVHEVWMWCVSMDVVCVVCVVWM